MTAEGSLSAVFSGVGIFPPNARTYLVNSKNCSLESCSWVTEILSKLVVGANDTGHDTLIIT